MQTYSPSSATRRSPQQQIEERLARLILERRGKLPDERPKAGIPFCPHRPTLRSWLGQVTPQWNWDWRHLRYVQEQLERVTAGESKRLMLFLPPRHGKSELTTIRYPVYRLEHDTGFRVCVGAYNQNFAERFGRRSRRIAQGRLAISQERSAAKEWETVGGGVFRSCGVGNPPTGEGFDLIIIDDPVKSREEAESEAYRERVWDWYKDDLYTRQEPGCSIVLIMTRWHEDDLAGKLLAAAKEEGDAWEVVNLPALAEENDPLGRAVGEALCPDRFDADRLRVIKGVQGSYSFDALYQQRPSAREGSFFKVGKLQYLDVDEIPILRRETRAWDMGATEGDGDPSAGVRIGQAEDGRIIVYHVAHGQWSTDTRNQKILETAQADGKRVRIRGPQDPGAAGVEAAKAFTRLLAGYNVRTERVTGPKEVRADPFSAQVNAGNVWLVRGSWNAGFVEELRQFPHGKHDDRVDAAADAFNDVAGRGVWGFT